MRAQAPMKKTGKKGWLGRKSLSQQSSKTGSAKLNSDPQGLKSTLLKKLYLSDEWACLNMALYSLAGWEPSLGSVGANVGVEP